MSSISVAIDVEYLCKYAQHFSWLILNNTDLSWGEELSFPPDISTYLLTLHTYSAVFILKEKVVFTKLQIWF